MKKFFSTILYDLLQYARRVHYFYIALLFRDFTMIPRKDYISNLELCRHYKRVAGDIVECGTFRGGMIAGIAKILGNQRTYHLFDSFEGLPDVKEIDGVKAKKLQQNEDGSFDNCKASESDAIQAMEIARINNYVIHKGWFNQTMVNLEFSKGIAVLRLDGDWYESTMTCLTNLYPFLNTGGLIIIDDYYVWEGCSKAIHDYLSLNKLPCTINSFRGVCHITKL